MRTKSVMELVAHFRPEEGQAPAKYGLMLTRTAGWTRPCFAG
jgi:hypothetical protein